MLNYLLDWSPFNHFQQTVMCHNQFFWQLIFLVIDLNMFSIHFLWLQDIIITYSFLVDKMMRKILMIMMSHWSGVLLWFTKQTETSFAKFQNVVRKKNTSQKYIIDRVNHCTIDNNQLAKLNHILKWFAVFTKGHIPWWLEQKDT